MQRTLVVALLSLILAACAQYRTPGAGVNIGNLTAADEDIAKIMLREPAASFPARLAIARAQSPGYSSASGNSCYGKGRYCVVTTRDVESDQDFQRIAGWPMVAGIAPLNRILLPEQLDTIKDLRLGAARLKTDLLLVYSLDTRFDIESTEVGPLQLISLGFLPNKKALVTTTASGALFDVRTGFVYGVVESTAREDQRASVWSTQDAIENARLKTEAASFRGLVDEFANLWKGVVESHSRVPSSG